MRAQRGATGAHRGVENQEVVHMGVESEQMGEQKQVIDMKALGVYNPKAHANTQFFTQYATHLIFEDIHKALCAVEGV